MKRICYALLLGAVCCLSGAAGDLPGGYYRLLNQGLAPVEVTR